MEEEENRKQKSTRKNEKEAQPTAASLSSVKKQRETIEALASLLYAEGKGFTADRGNGDWYLMFSQQGSKSPKFQKLVSKKEKIGNTINQFDISNMMFYGISNKILKKGTLTSKVRYNPTKDGYSKSLDDKIVVRRITCDIVGASWKYWFFPKVPLPLKVNGGYLEFVYMDDDIRITRGNRGGMFIHFRPEFFQRQMKRYQL